MSIVLIARKHNLDPNQLVDTFIEALKKKRSYCGSLMVTCRKADHDSATFLIEKEEKVVWQSKINLESIRNPDIRDYIHNISIPVNVTKTQYLQNQKINELRFGMKGITVRGKITEIPPIKSVVTRWGSKSCVSNVTITDETGSIRLALWNKQVNQVRIGDTVELTNCYVSRYGSNPQLRLVSNGYCTFPSES